MEPEGGMACPAQALAASMQRATAATVAPPVAMSHHGTRWRKRGSPARLDSFGLYPEAPRGAGGC